MARVLLLNGPNLNLLGTREPELYGAETLESIEQRVKAVGRELGHEVLTFQSNAEHELIARIHAARSEGVAFLIVNPGAFTHTSIALRDAILATALPFIEVHLTNTQAREAFRRHSLAPFDGLWLDAQALAEGPYWSLPPGLTPYSPEHCMRCIENFDTFCSNLGAQKPSEKRLIKGNLLCAWILRKDIGRLRLARASRPCEPETPVPARRLAREASGNTPLLRAPRVRPART